MKYMTKKGENYPIPFDDKLFNSETYTTFEIIDQAPEPEPAPKPARRRAPKVEEPILVNVDLDVPFPDD